jgi:hypothetical protein
MSEEIYPYRTFIKRPVSDKGGTFIKISGFWRRLVELFGKFKLSGDGIIIEEKTPGHLHFRLTPVTGLKSRFQVSTSYANGLVRVKVAPGMVMSPNIPPSQAQVFYPTLNGVALNVTPVPSLTVASDSAHDTTIALKVEFDGATGAAKNLPWAIGAYKPLPADTQIVRQYSGQQTAVDGVYYIPLARINGAAVVDQVCRENISAMLVWDVLQIYF